MVAKFLLVGCGRIGMRHAGIIKKQAQLVAVCDIDFEKARAAGESFAVEYFTDYNQMLTAHPGADMVTICTPNGLHAAQSILALKKGFNVLCEKPMALSVADCSAMMEAAAAANRKLFIVKQNRFNPPVVAVKKLLEEKRLGNILSFQLSCFWNRDNNYYENSWKGTKAMDGGTLYTQFSHFIDLLYWMFGEVKTIQSNLKNSNHKDVIEFEDNGVVLLECESGAIGTLNYTVNAYQKNMEGSLTIFGDKGTVKIGGEYLDKLEYQQIENYKIPALKNSNDANQYGSYQGSMSNHAEVYEKLIDVLNKPDDTFTTNSFEGLKTVEIIERIYTPAAKNNISFN